MGLSKNFPLALERVLRTKTEHYEFTHTLAHAVVGEFLRNNKELAGKVDARVKGEALSFDTSKLIAELVDNESTREGLKSNMVSIYIGVTQALIGKFREEIQKQQVKAAAEKKLSMPRIP